MKSCTREKRGSSGWSFQCLRWAWVVLFWTCVTFPQGLAWLGIKPSKGRRWKLVDAPNRFLRPCRDVKGASGHGRSRKRVTFSFRGTIRSRKLFFPTEQQFSVSTASQPAGQVGWTLPVLVELMQSAGACPMPTLRSGWNSWRSKQNRTCSLRMLDLHFLYKFLLRFSAEIPRLFQVGLLANSRVKCLFLDGCRTNEFPGSFPCRVLAAIAVFCREFLLLRADLGLCSWRGSHRQKTYWISEIPQSFAICFPLES